MDTIDIDYFRRLLKRQLSDLLLAGDSTVMGMREGSNIFADPSEQASADESQTMLLRIRDRESKLIHKIYQALERIEEGTYGICETCGEDITYQRLNARPVTTQCIDCKSRSETLEKARGWA